MLLHAAQAAGYASAAFGAKSLAEVMKALGAGAPVDSKDPGEHYRGLPCWRAEGMPVRGGAE